jgi:hypothetical protein
MKIAIVGLNRAGSPREPAYRLTTPCITSAVPYTTLRQVGQAYRLAGLPLPSARV